MEKTQKIEKADQAAMAGVMRVPDFLWDDIQMNWSNATWEQFVGEHGEEVDTDETPYEPEEERWYIDTEEFQAEIIWLGGCPLLYIHKSEWMTRACKCSPCIPHANDLDNLDENGFDTYCLPEEDMTDHLKISHY